MKDKLLPLRIILVMYLLWMGLFTSNGTFILLMCMMVFLTHQLFVDIHFKTGYKELQLTTYTKTDKSLILIILTALFIKTIVLNQNSHSSWFIGTISMGTIAAVLYIVKPFGNTILQVLMMIFGFIYINLLPYSTQFSQSYQSTLLVWSLIISSLNISVAILIFRSQNTASIVADLATYLFSFSIIAMYFFYNEIFIRWYGNLPVEISVLRDISGSIVVFIILIFSFFVPFALLLSRKYRGKIIMAKAASLSVIIGHSMFLTQLYISSGGAIHTMMYSGMIIVILLVLFIDKNRTAYAK